MRMLAFALHLLGARRKVVAALVSMPEESVKTALGLALRGGFPALRDRRLSATPAVTRASPSPPQVSVCQEQEWCVVAFGVNAKTLRIPVSHPVKVRTVLLSLVNAELLSVQESASGLGLRQVLARQLAGQLAAVRARRAPRAGFHQRRYTPTAGRTQGPGNPITNRAATIGQGLAAIPPTACVRAHRQGPPLETVANFQAGIAGNEQFVAAQRPDLSQTTRQCLRVVSLERFQEDAVKDSTLGHGE